MASLPENCLSKNALLMSILRTYRNQSYVAKEPVKVPEGVKRVANNWNNLKQSSSFRASKSTTAINQLTKERLNQIPLIGTKNRHISANKCKTRAEMKTINFQWDKLSTFCPVKISGMSKTRQFSSCAGKSNLIPTPRRNASLKTVGIVSKASNTRCSVELKFYQGRTIITPRFKH